MWSYNIIENFINYIIFKTKQISWGKYNFSDIDIVEDDNTHITYPVVAILFYSRSSNLVFLKVECGY